MNETLGNGSDIMADAQSILAYKVGRNIHTYYFPVITVIGFSCNVIALCILLKPQNRRYPCYRTVTALSFSDMVIILSGYYNWVMTLTDSMTETHCKIWTYFFQTAALSSALMVVFVTIHKYLAFVSPFRSHNLRSPSRTLKIIICIVAISILYNIVHIFGVTTVDNSFCVGITSIDPYNKTISWIALVLHAILPVTFVVILNSLIVRAVHVSKKFYQSSVRSNRSQAGVIKRAEERQNTSTDNLSSSTRPTAKPKPPLHFTKSDQPKNPLRHYDRPTATYHRQSSILLTSVTCVFALLTPPLYLFHIVYNFVDYSTTADAYATYVLVYYICL